PLVIAFTDKAMPVFSVTNALSAGTGFGAAYLSYWQMFIARPDALKLCCLYGAALLLVGAVVWLYVSSTNPSRSVKSGVLGDARIITSTSEIRSKNDFWNGRKTPKREGLVLGAGHRGYFYDSTVPHAFIVGKTGSGKSQLMVLETLHLLMAKTWNIIATGKSELVELTGDKAVSLGYRRLIFDLNGYPGASRFNPIELVVHYVEAQNMSRAMQTARQVAEDLIPLPGGSNDYFPRAARSILTAIILIVAMADVPKEKKNMASVCAIINRGTTGEGKDPSAPLKAYIRSLGEDHPAFACASEFLSDGGTTVAGKNVISTLKDALSIFSDEAVTHITETSDMSMYDLINSQTIVYIHLLEEGHPYQVLYAVFFNQFWRVALEIAGKRGGKLPHETAIVGDELGNCNKLSCLEDMVTTGRSMRFHVYAFVQNMGQLRRYNKPGDKDAGMNKILGSMDIKVALSLAALEDCRYFTELVGKHTVRSQSTSNTHNGSSGTSSGTSYNETAVDVIHPWDWPKRTPIRDGSIVIKGGENPAPDRKGNFRMRLAYANRTPAGKFFDLGTEEHEAAKRLEFHTRMEAAAETAEKPAAPWCPNFSEYLPKQSAEDAIIEDEFGAWDAVM
ncbi:MAG: type IV secretory system conjugative DNA transfer family protein, partial [Eggerthellaceae bacterium]|nr:type IV secretory system conjugative DNA transfer family protein [Eggerthellaceae bacterium]